MAIYKSMKYELVYLDGLGEFSNAQAELWSLQKQTRAILNKSIQEMYMWDCKDGEHYRKYGTYIDFKAETGHKRIDSYVYNIMRGEYPYIGSSVVMNTVNAAFTKFSGVKVNVRKGIDSIPVYKGDQAILIGAESIKIIESDNFKCRLALFSIPYKKEKGYTNVEFGLIVKDKLQKTILGNIMSGDYKLCRCKLYYKNKKWFLVIMYAFNPKKESVREEKILGVDLGCKNVIVASSFGTRGSFIIEGGEVAEYARRIEARNKSLQRQSKYCGEGRIGHGTRKRISPSVKSGKKIDNFKNTINHKYAKALVRYAVKNGYGTIQMEDLRNIEKQNEYPPILRHWTYYDLQTKIESKANECGIRVVKIKPAYTSQRCSRCGNIDKKNRQSQANFVCTKCGFKANADYNASQNISVKDIENIIANEIKKSDN